MKRYYNKLLAEIKECVNRGHYLFSYSMHNYAFDDILSVRSQIAARLGFDITDHHVISYFCLDLHLLYAARLKNQAGVEYAISRGADMHCFDDLTFRIAVEQGCMNMVKYLIDIGADAHKILDRDRYCTLSIAKHNGHHRVVEYLESLVGARHLD